MQIARLVASEKVCTLRGDEHRERAHNAIMSRAGRDKADVNAGNNLRAWREYRHLTQAQLAEAVGTTGAVISLLESADRQLSPKWLAKLAPALRTRPGILLEYRPQDIDTDILQALTDLSDNERRQVLAITQTFRKAS